MFWFFDHKSGRVLTPWPGVESPTPALEGEAVATGPPGKSEGLLY